MRATFEKALDLVLAHEGGFVNHPKDPGGATNFGVTQKLYDAWNRTRGYTRRSVKGIQHVEVEAINLQNYWDRIQGDRLPAGLDYAVFDFAVIPADVAEKVMGSLSLVIGALAYRERMNPKKRLTVF